MTQLAKDSATPTSSSMKGFCGLLDISCLKAARSSVVITNHDSRAVPQEKSEYDTHSSQDESVKAASNFWFAQLSGDKPFVVLRTMSNVSEGESRPCISFMPEIWRLVRDHWEEFDAIHIRRRDKRPFGAML